MVVEVSVQHVYKYPVEFVAMTHLTKIPHPEEIYILSVEIAEEYFDPEKEIDYKRRVATCPNVIPYLLRCLPILNSGDIKLQEELWFNSSSRVFQTRSRNLTWSDYGDMVEDSLFRPCTENPQWTVFEQTNAVNCHGVGWLQSPIEMFAKGFMQTGVERTMRVMDKLLAQRAKTNMCRTYIKSAKHAPVTPCMPITESLSELSTKTSDGSAISNGNPHESKEHLKTQQKNKDSICKESIAVSGDNARHGHGDLSIADSMSTCHRDSSPGNQRLQQCNGDS